MLDSMQGQLEAMRLALVAVLGAACVSDAQRQQIADHLLDRTHVRTAEQLGEGPAYLDGLSTVLASLASSLRDSPDHLN